jgi:hypothetical protein
MRSATLARLSRVLRKMTRLPNQRQISNRKMFSVPSAVRTSRRPDHVINRKFTQAVEKTEHAGRKLDTF